jgi:hypothetical protein
VDTEKNMRERERNSREGRQTAAAAGAVVGCGTGVEVGTKACAVD